MNHYVEKAADDQPENEGGDGVKYKWQIKSGHVWHPLSACVKVTAIIATAKKHFWKSGGVVHAVRERRPETMKINHEVTKGTKKRTEKTFV
ncbi:MAG: hypothetical protein AB7O81_35095, partial [Blastocatellales bacterium]